VEHPQFRREENGHGAVYTTGPDAGRSVGLETPALDEVSAEQAATGLREGTLHVLLADTSRARLLWDWSRAKVHGSGTGRRGLFIGTSVQVRDIADPLRAGRSAREVQALYPFLSFEDIVMACLYEASDGGQPVPSRLIHEEQERQALMASVPVFIAWEETGDWLKRRDRYACTTVQSDGAADTDWSLVFDFGTSPPRMAFLVDHETPGIGSRWPLYEGPKLVGWATVLPPGVEGLAVEGKTPDQLTEDDVNALLKDIDL
jgi:uncharacterized protein (DUF433 family)